MRLAARPSRGLTRAASTGEDGVCNHGHVHDEVHLFSLTDDTDDPIDEVASAPIATWQVDLLRKTLDARGLTEVTDRQRAVKQYAGRPVASLRELTSEEAIKILAKLGEQRSAAGTGSLWDQRDEDTWIDRL